MKLYTISEMAGMLQVSPAQVRRLLREGLIPCTDISSAPGRRKAMRVRADDFEAFLEERRVYCEVPQ